MNTNSTTSKDKSGTTPRIYVASLADYNAGRLHGRWIDADQPVETIREQIAEMLRQSPEPLAEEWAIHDYKNFGTLRLSEFEDLEKLAEVAFLITEHGAIFAELVGYVGGVSALDDARAFMQDGYRGAYESLPEYVQESVLDCFGSELNHLPGFIRYHIDWDGIAHDMELAGDVFTLQCDGKVHVFDGQF